MQQRLQYFPHPRTGITSLFTICSSNTQQSLLYVPRGWPSREHCEIVEHFSHSSSHTAPNVCLSKYVKQTSVVSQPISATAEKFFYYKVSFVTADITQKRMNLVPALFRLS